jgi:hypothetical protein
MIGRPTIVFPIHADNLGVFGTFNTKAFNVVPINVHKTSIYLTLCRMLLLHVFSC